MKLHLILSVGALIISSISLEADCPSCQRRRPDQEPLKEYGGYDSPRRGEENMTEPCEDFAERLRESQVGDAYDYQNANTQNRQRTQSSQQIDSSTMPGQYQGNNPTMPGARNSGTPTMPGDYSGSNSTMPGDYNSSNPPKNILPNQTNQKMDESRLQSDAYSGNVDLPYPSNVVSPPGSERTIPDTQIMEKVQSLINGGMFNAGYPNVTASVQNGNVSLSGYVSSEDDRRGLARKISQIDGVKNIDNQLIIRAY